MTVPIGLRQAVRDMPREAWVLFAGTFVNRFGSFVLPFLVLYLVKRGYSTIEAGAVVSLYSRAPRSPQGPAATHTRHTRPELSGRFCGTASSSAS